jgi:hypothetical protein
VDSVAETVDRVLAILTEPDAAEEMGLRAHDVVRRTFLSTANLANYLKLFNDLNDLGAR